MIIQGKFGFILLKIEVMFFELSNNGKFWLKENDVSSLEQIMT